MDDAEQARLVGRSGGSDGPDGFGSATIVATATATPGAATEAAATEAGMAQPEPPPVPPSESGDMATAMIVFVLAVGCALTFSFLCSIFESVLLSVSRGHVEAMAKKGTRSGVILKRWKRYDIEVPIAAILILNTIAHTVGATMAGSSYEKVFGVGTTAIFSGVFTLAILLFTEIIPKTLGVAFADRLAGPVTVSVRVLVFLLWPVIKVTSSLSRMLTRGHQKPVTSIEEIRLLAALGEHEGAVGARFASFVEGIASLRELTAHDVMVPRVGVAYLSGKKTSEENLEIVRECGHSRFPFTPTGDLDDVDGIVLAKEMLFLDRDLPDDAEPNWDTLKSQLLVVPESNSLDKVLRLFQEQRKHLAVVVDEYGGTQGVITMEDVLEEIVGEIEDETDRVEQLITKRADGSYRCRGMAEVRKLFRLLSIEEKVEAVTVAGLVADLLGHVPKEGEEVSWKGLHFKVEQASKRRAERVLVVELPNEGDGGDEPDSG